MHFPPFCQQQQQEQKHPPNLKNLKRIKGKSILQVPDTGTQVLDNTRLFLCSSIVSFWLTLACSKERKDHIFVQYWYTKNVPVLTNTGTFQYLGPEVYFFRIKKLGAFLKFFISFLEMGWWLRATQDVILLGQTMSLVLICLILCLFFSHCTLVIQTPHLCGIVSPICTSSARRRQKKT